MLQNIPLRPKEIARLVDAYERTLRKFGLKECDDPLTQLIAKKIIKVGQTGVRDPEHAGDRQEREGGLAGAGARHQGDLARHGSRCGRWLTGMAEHSG